MRRSGCCGKGSRERGDGEDGDGEASDALSRATGDEKALGL